MFDYNKEFLRWHCCCGIDSIGFKVKFEKWYEIQINENDGI